MLEFINIFTLSDTLSFLCFTSFFAHLSAVSNYFNDNGQSRILGK